ncbi:MAG TPA: SBBP repeat-containing protein [Bryobacteraceae bacterium]|nr:SBBP repeat-containing protein [Bryobacteraceae bacterium]
MRKLCLAALRVLACAAPALGQELLNRQVLSGNGSDQPNVIATDSRGYVYVAGNTTSGNFPVTNALEPQPVQGALEVSEAGAPFVNSGFAASSVSALAASSDGKLVIAGTPSGIFRSGDQGVTWTPAADLLPPAAALAVDPVNSSNAYALLQNGAFYKSVNGGVNWQTSSAPLPQVYITQIAISPQTPSTLYAWDNYTIYKSTDGAQIWQALWIPGSNTRYPRSL